MAYKILSVDDETDLELLISQKFRRKIRKGEYEFVFAHSGTQALELLAEHPDIDIILSDINMPEMDGLTLLSELGKKKLPSLKTLIVSAYGDMENIRTAMNRGAYDFVTKPIDFDDLEITLSKTIEHVEQLKNSVVTQQRLMAIEQDLSIAKQIQLSLVPRKFPAFPNRSDFDIHASMEAAKSVGGDLYDFFLIDESRLGLVVGDVCGKGIPAALFMAISRTIIRATALKGMGAAECMRESNQLLCNESTNSMFITVFYGILNLKTHELEYTLAGHNPSYIMRRAGAIEQLEKTGDLALAVMEGIDFSAKSVQLSKGDQLYAFTDGVPEAMNNQKQQFTESRLIEKLSSYTSATPQEVCENIIRDVHQHAQGAEQSDDVTMLCVKLAE